MTTMAFVLVNESSLSDAAHGGPLTTEVLQSIATAVSDQLNNEVAGEWGGTYSVRVGAPNGSDVKAHEIACWIKDSLPDAPGAVGYHDRLPNGAPVAYFAREDCPTLTSGAESLSVCISHEACETAGDPGANRWADVAGDGSEKALELCDQVQNTYYAGTGGVSVSNFLLQSAFAPGSPAPFDYLKVMPSADDYSNGYEIVRGVDQDPQDLTSKRSVKVLGHPKMTQKKSHHTSRLRRRGVAPKA